MWDKAKKANKGRNRDLLNNPKEQARDFKREVLFLINPSSIRGEMKLLISLKMLEREMARFVQRNLLVAVDLRGGVRVR